MLMHHKVQAQFNGGRVILSHPHPSVLGSSHTGSRSSQRIHGDKVLTVDEIRSHPFKVNYHFVFH